MAKTPTFPAGDLKDIIDYDPDTGVVTWKKRETGSPHWKDTSVKRFNMVTAGKQAGTVKKAKNDTVQMNIKLPDGKSYLLHRVIWALETGEWPEGMVSHKDGDRTNNALENLQEATQGDLNRNGAVRSDNTSGIKGVSWIESRGYYKVRTEYNGEVRTKNVKTLEEAKRVKEEQLLEIGPTSG